MRNAILLLVFAALVFSVAVFALSFNATPTGGQNATTSTINQTFNITIINTNATANITQVNFTLPTGIVFVTGSNSTNANSTSFAGLTATANWTNSTPGGIINGSASAWFFFKANVSFVFNITNITITTLDTSNVQNTTNYTVSIQPPVVSSGGEFGVMQPTLYLNWTNTPVYQQNITIIANGTRNTNIMLETTNATSLFTGNYSQTSCGSAIVQNASGYSNVTGPINGGASYNSANISITANASLCAPGRYWIQRLTIRNQTNNAENLNITVFVDVPLTSSNINNSTGTASLSGTLPANATTYQSYYFNTSAIQNATSVYVNLSASSIAHLLLFDNSGNMKTESVNGSTTQYLSYNYLPSPQASPWEVRIYGNSTSPINYSGVIVFSSLNVTNYTTGQTVSNLTYGNLNASSLVATNLNLTNMGGLNLGNVSLSSSLYRVQNFNGGGNRNFTFLVGDSNIESKVRVNLTWTGASNYTLNVYNPAGTLVMTSGNIYTFANVSNASVLGLYADTASITPGYWTASVVSSSGNDPFNVTVFTFENAANNWITTNVSTTISLSNFSSNTSVQVNLTIPTLAIDGNYQGNLTFTDANSGTVNVPISFNVTAPTLLVLNASNIPTFLNPFNASDGSNTFRINENIGATLNKTILINLTNIGTFNSSINMVLNSTNLTCVSSGCSGYFANLTYNTTTNVTSHNSSLIQINVSYNSSFPAGTYDGWIFINATNNTANLSSHPYPAYNLTVRLNLSNSINVIVGQIASPNGTNFLGNATYAQNATVNFSLSYINGTLLSPIEENSLNTSNFTIWLIEGNTSYRIPTSGGLGSFNGTNPIYNVASNSSAINFTVPANMPGGQYAVYVQLNSYNRSDGMVFASNPASNNSLIINNTGLFVTPIRLFSGTLSNGTSDYINITVQNFGPLYASSGQITITKNNAYTTLSSPMSNCNATSGTTVVLFYLNAYNSSGCYIAWNVTAGQSAGIDTVGMGLAGGIWFNNISAFNITVTAPAASQPPGVSGPGAPVITAGNGTATVAINLTAGDNQIPIGFVSGLYVSSIVVNVNSSLNNVRMAVNSLDAKPSAITQNVNDSVFKYFEIVPTNIADTNINNLTISFYVTRSWVAANNINATAISLYRYANGAWAPLPTNKTSEGTDYLYYSAVSPGLSTYAIAGLPLPAQQQNMTAAGNLTQGGNASTGNVTVTSLGILELLSPWGYALLAIGAAGILVYYMLGKKSGPRQPGSKWDQLRKKWS